MTSDTETSLFEALESSHSTDLLDRFTLFLRPISQLINLVPKNPNQGKLKRPTKKNLRVLSKQYYPFLKRCENKLRNLLARRSSNSSSPTTASIKERALQLFLIYQHIVDYMDSIQTCVADKHPYINGEKTRLIQYMEYFGNYEQAEEESKSILETLELKQRKRKRDSDCVKDPRMVILGIIVVASLSGCAWKRKLKDSAVYKKNMEFSNLVLSEARCVDPEPIKKQHEMLVKDLHECALFLAGECISLESDMVREFVQMTLRESLQFSKLDHFLNICSAIDKRWESRPLLVLDMLRVALEYKPSECKVGNMKAVTELLEFVSYSAQCFCTASVSICKDASELLYRCSHDLLQVPSHELTIMSLYATGLYFKFSILQSKQSDCSIQVIGDVLEKEGKLPRLADSLYNLAEYFNIKHDVDYISLVESEGHRACSNLHENAYFLSYLDALDFLCGLLAEYVNLVWKVASREKVVCLSSNINIVQAAFCQFCRLILVALKCNKTSQKDKDRLSKSCKTLHEVAASFLKVSMWVSGEYQILSCVIPTEWIRPKWLDELVSLQKSIVRNLYNAGHLKQASLAFQLYYRSLWVQVKLLCQMPSNNVKAENRKEREEDIEAVILYAFESNPAMVNAFRKSGDVAVCEVVIKTIVELSVVCELLPDSTLLLALVKQWVKVFCQEVDNLKLLVSQCSKLSNMTTGKILEQALSAYVSMEDKDLKLCQERQREVIDVLLNDVFKGQLYNLQRSRILVCKGRAFRAQGIEGLHDCIKCLREAISLLKDISSKFWMKVAPVYYQLGVIYLLIAQCNQEDVQYSQDPEDNSKVILQDIQLALQNFQLALQSYSSINIQGLVELSLKKTILLLCNTVDLVSMKGCMELQIDICKMIMRFKQENIPIEKCLTMLWSERRVNHSLCSSPIDNNFILSISHDLGDGANSIEFWISGLRDFPLHLLMLLQKLVLCESVTPEVSRYKLDINLGMEVSNTIDKVAGIVSSLISDIHLDKNKAPVAAYFCYDLSERLLSNGRLFEVGILNEITGNGVEAEDLFHMGEKLK